MKHKTAELEPPLLDVAAGMCEGDFDPHRPRHERRMIVNDFGRVLAGPQGHSTKQYEWSPSTRWDHGGPIIERERIAVFACGNEYHPMVWIAVPFGVVGYEGYAYIDVDDAHGVPISRAPTPLIAAMRAYVASKLGEEVELP